MESLGPKIRRQRLELGLTLDEISGRTSISKPYLSLIETGRVTNPPSDEKLRRLEQSLGFSAGELLTQAHLQRTPRDVRAALQELMAAGKGGESAGKTAPTGVGPAKSSKSKTAARASEPAPASAGDDPDPARLASLLRELGASHAANLSARAAPVINVVSAGYPRDFSDLSFPRRAAGDYVSCPDITDPDAFAARVHGDSMTPKFSEGDIVIFSPALSARDGNDCFVRFADGTTTFCRVFFESNDAGQAQLRLQPRNERHRAQVVAPESVAGLYKAVYRYQRVDED